MTFKKFDAGKEHRTSKKMQGGDCQVRALCTASSMSYPQAYNLLYKVQGEMRTPGFRLELYLQHKPDIFGVARYLPFPAVKGQRRMTAAQFVQRYPKGRFVLNLARHVTAVVDGTVLDTWDCTRKCVYGAWELREAKQSVKNAN
jgi:hypothetical protein